jgi:hypothetical protein
VRRDEVGNGNALNGVGILIRFAGVARLDEIIELAGSILNLIADDADGARALQAAALGWGSTSISRVSWLASMVHSSLPGLAMTNE